MGSLTDENAVEAPKQKTQPHLMPQDASKVDPTKLCALTPEVVSFFVVWMDRQTFPLIFFSQNHSSITY